jgi:hypothetical protein
LEVNSLSRMIDHIILENVHELPQTIHRGLSKKPKIETRNVQTKF